jgi:hypothetical protein
MGYSIFSQPLQVEPKIYKGTYESVEYREILGKKAFFHWHCKKPMRKVMRIDKSIDGPVKGYERTVDSDFICLVCNKRKSNDLD